MRITVLGILCPSTGTLCAVTLAGYKKKPKRKTQNKTKKKKKKKKERRRQEKRGEVNLDLEGERIVSS